MGNVSAQRVVRLSPAQPTRGFAGSAQPTRGVGGRGGRESRARRCVAVLAAVLGAFPRNCAQLWHTCSSHPGEDVGNVSAQRVVRLSPAQPTRGFAGSAQPTRGVGGRGGRESRARRCVAVLAAVLGAFPRNCLF